MKLDHLITPDPAKSGWGWMPPTEEVFSMFEWVNNVCRPTNVLEIGFHVGHSTTYMLETFEGCIVESYAQSGQFRGQAHKMMDLYEGRLSVHYAHSCGVYGEGRRKAKYDFALIDGGHDYHTASSDILQCIMLGIPWLLIDNTDLVPVDTAVKLFDSVVDLSKTFEYTATHNGITKVNEARLYYVRTNSIQQLIRQQDNQTDRFQVLP